MSRSQHMMLTTIGVFLSLNVQVTHDNGYRESLLLPLLPLSAVFLRLWQATMWWQRTQTGITHRLRLYRLVAGIGLKSVLYGAGAAI